MIVTCKCGCGYDLGFFPDEDTPCPYCGKIKDWVPDEEEDGILKWPKIPCVYCPHSGRAICDEKAGTFRKGRKKIICPCGQRQAMKDMTDEPLTIAIKPIKIGKKKTTIIDTGQNIKRYDEEQEQERQEAIKEYARHYHHPITDIDGLNKTLEENTGYTTTADEVAELLGYADADIE